jgi:hypothetical protein
MLRRIPPTRYLRDAIRIKNTRHIRRPLSESPNTNWQQQVEKRLAKLEADQKHNYIHILNLRSDPNVVKRSNEEYSEVLRATKTVNSTINTVLFLGACIFLADVYIVTSDKYADWKHKKEKAKIDDIKNE